MSTLIRFSKELAMLRIRSAASGIKNLLVVTAAVTGVAIQTAQAQVPAALSQAPDGAQLVVIVPSMSGLSGKLALLNQTLGLEMAELNDALGAFKAESGMAEGLNDAGAALFVVQDLTPMFDNGEPDFVMVVPVTDYQAFVGNFQGVDSDSDQVFELTLPNGQSGYAKESGGYAVLGDSLSSVQGYAPGGNADAIGNRIGELGQDYLSKCDAAVYIDLEALAPRLIEEINKGLAEMDQNMDQAGGMMDPSQLEMVKAMVALYATAGKAVLNSAEGVVIALDIGEHGVGITDAIQFKPNSPATKYLPGGTGNTASLLSQLPKGAYLVAAAFDAEAIAMGDLFDAAIAAMPQDNAQIDLYRDALPMIKQIKQYAGVFYTPDPGALMGGGGALNTLQSYTVQDSAAYLQMVKQYVTDLNGTSIPMAMPMAPGAGGAAGDGAAPAMSYTTSYTDNALQLDGVQVDQYAMQVQMPPEMMMQMGPAAGFMQMFTNINGYYADAGGHVLATTTLDQQLMARGLATGKTGDGVGTDDSLAKVREKAIPPGSAAEFYISLAGIAETASPFAMMFGMPAIEAPADLPPVAIGLGIKGNSSAARFYVPNETTKFVIDTAKSIQAQMMGGQGGPGGPDGQPQGPGAPPPPF
jgi:hypothetical protein